MYNPEQTPNYNQNQPTPTVPTPTQSVPPSDGIPEVSELQKTLLMLQQLTQNKNALIPPPEPSNKRPREYDDYDRDEPIKKPNLHNDDYYDTQDNSPRDVQGYDYQYSGQSYGGRDGGRDRGYHSGYHDGGYAQGGYDGGYAQGGYRGDAHGQHRGGYDDYDDDRGSTLFVGNLHPDISEQEVYHVFSKCGVVNEIRLKRHRDTGKVKGYGFVEFKNGDGADLAVQTLNNVQMLGRPTKVEFSHMPKILPPTNQVERASSFNSSPSYPPSNPYQPNPSPYSPVNPNLGNPQNIMATLGALTGGNVPAGNPNVSAQALIQMLSNPGVLSSLGMANPPQFGVPPPNLNGDPSFAQQQSRVSEPQRRRPDNCTTVFVGNLSYDIDDETIKSVFRSVGDIKAIRWLNDNKTGKFKGCGFIEFFDRDTTIRAAQLNGTIVMNRPMRVDFATERPSGGSDYEDEGGKHYHDRSNSRDRSGSRDRGRYRDHSRDRNRDKRSHSKDRYRDRRDNWDNRDNRNSRDNRNDRSDRRAPQSRPEGCNTLFIGNLTDGTTEDDVRDVFSEFGKIQEVRFLFERGTGRFRGCGFVEFEDERATEEAVNLNGHIIRGRPIRVDYSQGRRRD